MTRTPMPWSPAVATGVGSMPGTSSLEAARVVCGELPGLIHVAELPARGPGADIIGRTGGLLSAVSSGLALETTPAGWRFAMAPGRQMRLAQSFLGEDLDALEEQAQDYAGPVKCQAAGPWTLAAAIELRTGERALRDHAAVVDIADALGEALRDHVADLRRRVPHATSVVVQLDEPSLAAVLAGRIGTASGLSSYSAVDPQEAERVLRRVLDPVRETGAIAGIHCCAPDAPLPLMSVADFVSLDVTAVGQDADEALGQAWEAGVGIIAGCVPSVDADGREPWGDTRASAPLRALLHRLGLEDDRWLAQVAVSPTCGLAGASPQWVLTALRACTAAGRVLRNDEPGEHGEVERRGR